MTAKNHQSYMNKITPFHHQVVGLKALYEFANYSNQNCYINQSFRAPYLLVAAGLNLISDITDNSISGLETTKIWLYFTDLYRLC